MALGLLWNPVGRLFALLLDSDRYSCFSNNIAGYQDSTDEVRKHRLNKYLKMELFSFVPSNNFYHGL